VESYLNNNNSVFPTVDSDNEKFDGSYLTLDTVRGDLIRSGFAEQGLGRRWKEHLRASHLTDRNTKDRPQYHFSPMSPEQEGHCVTAPAKNGHGNEKV
jgi:hypothetical protein